MLYKQIEHIIQHIKEDENFLDFASYPLKGKKVKGKLLLKKNNIVLSGIEIISTIYNNFNINFYSQYKSGSILNNVNIPFAFGEIEGDAYNILLTERTILNTISLLSAIATKTFNLQNKLMQMGYKTKIAGTRKILPQIGYLQKLAIIHGGGDTHRFNLSDTIMIKDNHLKIYGSIKNAISEIKKIKSFTQKIEVEAENRNDALIALKEGADIIMLDNFTSDEAKKTALYLKNIKESVIIEVSGGINENNYLDYADNSIDIISMGSLTTNISYVDISLEIV